ncbi:MAG: hypothetical protein O3C43_24690 [Verrucomicrobia bacterium]|nr:hypothetical protein [Verrucomicrobiota bacterium]MDA1069687.1 hypothetical protein [Verrucomicrobiota bacterium]
MRKTTTPLNTMARAAIILAILLAINFKSYGQGLGLDMGHPNVRAVIAVQNEVTSDLMNTSGILGTAVGLNDNNTTSLVVYVDQDSPSRVDIVRSLPPQIRGTVFLFGTVIDEHLEWDT